jgi:hypothetical protein
MRDQGFAFLAARAQYLVRGARMTDNDRSNINMSSIPVAGIGGLGLMVVAAIMAYVLPEARAFAIAGLTGGFIAACALIAYRRLSTSEPKPGATLMIDSSSETAATADRRRADSELRLSPLATAR